MDNRFTDINAKAAVLQPERGKRSRPALIGAGILLACASAGLVVGAFSKSASPRREASAPPTSGAAPSWRVTPQTILPGERLRGEIVAIRPWGFEPEEIIRPQGRFLLRVDNRSGLNAVSLMIDSESGTRLRAETVPRTKLDWREIVDLPPGNYLLKEANNPDWVCKITVLP